jgi:hypothetical protein
VAPTHRKHKKPNELSVVAFNRLIDGDVLLGFNDEKSAAIAAIYYAAKRSTHWSARQKKKKLEYSFS